MSAATADVDPGKTLPLLDPAQPAPEIPREDLPHCPSCKKGLLRPGVVWFGESLDDAMLDGIEKWMDAGPVDLIVVVGTSAQVWPAAGYIFEAKRRGAAICIVNLEAEDEDELRKVRNGDFAFGQDAASFLPGLLEPFIGKMNPDGTFGGRDEVGES